MIGNSKGKKRISSGDGYLPAEQSMQEKVATKKGGGGKGKTPVFAVNFKREERRDLVKEGEQFGGEVSNGGGKGDWKKCGAKENELL